MQLLLPAAYTAIALGFVDSVLSGGVHASFECCRSLAPSLLVLLPSRSSSALRSYISSEGSLLFVVCPSRISTHSVSNETRIIAPSLFLPPRARPLPRRPFLPAFSSCSAVPVSPSSPPCVIGTRAIKRHPVSSRGAPLKRAPIKMATALPRE